MRGMKRVLPSARARKRSPKGSGTWSCAPSSFLREPMAFGDAHLRNTTASQERARKVHNIAQRHSADPSRARRAGRVVVIIIRAGALILIISTTDLQDAQEVHHHLCFHHCRSLGGQGCCDDSYPSQSTGVQPRQAPFLVYKGFHSDETRTAKHRCGMLR